MKVRLIQGRSAEKVEEQVNEFLDNSKIKVLELKYRPMPLYFSVMVIYEEAGSAN